MVIYPIEFIALAYLLPPRQIIKMIKLEIAHKNFIEQLKSEGKSEATLVAYKKDIEQLNKYLADKNISLTDDIQSSHIQEFMNSLSAQNYTPKSISRKTNAARTYVRFLHSKGYMKTDISMELKHPKVDLKAPRILSKMEYGALRDVARTDTRTYTMLEVLLQLGVSISELSEIELEHLNLKEEEGTLFVPKKNNKEARNIPINKIAADTLNKYLTNERPSVENSKYVFITKSGKPLLVRNIRSTIDRYFKIAGVENAKVNDLRHTFIAHHLKNGVNVSFLSKIAGHKRITTTEKYLQYINKPEESNKLELSVL
jgi:site-specific recombinase XerD